MKSTSQFLRLFLFALLVFETRSLWSDDMHSRDLTERDWEVQELVQRSRETRAQIEQKLNARSPATITGPEDHHLHKEWENLLLQNEKDSWFDEIDRLIQNEAFSFSHSKK